MLIYLAISCGLIGLLFLYVRQKIQSVEVRINTISDILREFTHELAGPMQHQLNQDIQNLNIQGIPESDSSDSESESDCDSDESSDSEESFVQPELENIILDQPLESIQLDVDSEKIEVSDDEEIKVVSIEKSPYDGLSVKELKEKVAQLGGPSNLKTKKLLLEFLEKK